MKKLLMLFVVGLATMVLTVGMASAQAPSFGLVNLHQIDGSGVMGNIIFVENGGVITATGMASGLSGHDVGEPGQRYFSLLYKGDATGSQRSKPAGKAHEEGPCEPGRPTAVGDWDVTEGIGALGPVEVFSSTGSELFEYQTVSIRFGTSGREGVNILLACGQLAISQGYAHTQN